MLLKEIVSLLPIRKKLVYSLSIAWLLGLFFSYYSINHYQTLILSTQELIKQLNQAQEADHMFLLSNNYNMVNKLDLNRKQEDLWRQRLLHQLEEEPVYVAKVDDKEDFVLIEVIGNYIDILSWMDKSMNSMPYIRLVPQEITYDAGGTKWLLKACI